MEKDFTQLPSKIKFNYRTEVYISKKSNDESDFWKGGKYAYEDEKMINEVVYKTMNRAEHHE